MDINEFCNQYNDGRKNFQEINLVGVKFENLVFEDIDLSRANLKNVEIKNCIFNDSSFYAVNLKDAIFDDSQFNNINFQKVCFESIKAILLEFRRCNLNDSDFTHSCLGDVYFSNSSLQRSKWQGAFWSGGITESDLIQASMDSLKVGCIELVRVTLPNGILTNQTWREGNIEGNNYYLLDSFSISETTCQDDLRSNIKDAYSELYNLLSARKWSQADRETAYLICKAIGLEFPDMIEEHELVLLSCKDLEIIDLLWSHFSGGRFGFRIQNKIWQSLSSSYTYSIQTYKQFYNLTSWDEETGLEGINFFPSPLDIDRLPAGYFPALGLWPSLYGVFIYGQGSTHEFSALYARIKSCKLP
jgi:uncharacterized protein YjbI with pentapeptide repeats